MAKKGNKTLGYVFAGLILVGLVLVIVGMFVGEIVSKAPNIKGEIESKSVGLFEADTWGQTIVGDLSTPSNAFAIISFIVAIAGLVMLAVDSVLKLFADKNIKFFGLIGAALAIIGGILILVSGLVTANAWWDTIIRDGAVKDTLIKAGYDFAAGAGVWLGFVGGLVGGAAGLVGALKK